MFYPQFFIRFFARSPGHAHVVPAVRCARAIGFRSRLLCLLVTASVIFLASPVQARPFDCLENSCNLPGRETYPDFVLGTVKAVATETKTREIFSWAKQNDYWTLVPDDEKRFMELVQVMSVAIPGSDGEVELSLLMSREEYDSSPINPGDFVRYTRHPVDEPMTPLFRQADTKPYWDLFGCIAVLCRADDKPCPQRYVPGVYRFEDGVPLDRVTGEPVSDRPRISTETFLPMTAAE